MNIIDYQDNGLGLYRLDLKGMKEFLLVVKREQLKNRLKNCSRNLQLMINRDAVLGDSDAERGENYREGALKKGRRLLKRRLVVMTETRKPVFNLDEKFDPWREGPDSILAGLRTACLYSIDNSNPCVRKELVRVTNIGSDTYWVNFKRASYNKKTKLEGDLYNKIYSSAYRVMLSSRILNISGDRLQNHAMLGYDKGAGEVSEAIPGNKNDKFREVLGKKDNETLSQSQINAAVSVVRKPIGAVEKSYAKLTKRVEGEREEARAK